MSGQELQGAHERLRGARPLHRCPHEDDLHARAAERDLHDVVEGRAVGTGDDPDDPRLTRQRPLALCGEEALGGELSLELGQGDEERTLPGRLRAVDRELESPARRVHGGPPLHHHPRAGDDRPPRADRRCAVEHAVDRRVLVLVA